MKSLLLLTIVTLYSCVQKPEAVTDGRSTASVNPEAPYLWQNKTFPKTLYVSSNFTGPEQANLNAMANEWKLATANKRVWFNISNSTVTNKANNVNPDLLLDSTLGIYKVTNWPEDIPPDALAVTQIFGRRYNSGAENEYVGIEHADILVNYQWHNFDTNDNPADWDSDYDLQTVVLHELGHFLGMGHISRDENRNSSVMYPSITPREVKKIAQPRDITSLADLYGINLGGAGHAITNGAKPLHAPNDGDDGVEHRVMMELRADGSCVHRVNGVVVQRHHVELKRK